MEQFSVPTAPTAFDHFQAELVTRCTDSATSWNLPPETISELQAYQRRWDPAYAVSVNRNTACPANTTARQAVYEDYRKVIINVVNRYLLNSEVVSSGDKAILGIHERNVRTRRNGAPESYPVLQVMIGDPDVHELIYSDVHNPGNKGKPAGIGFCEVRYSIGQPVTAAEQATAQINLSRSGQTLRFDPEDSGKLVYYFARWVSSNGQPGPWAQVVSQKIR